MREYTGNDFSKKFAKVFNLPDAQAIAMMDADEAGMPVISFVFCVADFGVVAWNGYPKEGESYPDFYKRATRTNEMAKDAMATVLADINEMAKKAMEQQEELADGEPRIEIEITPEPDSGTGEAGEGTPTDLAGAVD